MNQTGDLRRHTPTGQFSVMLPEDDVIDLGRMWQAVLRYKWGVFGLAVATTLLAVLLVMGMEPVYRATASVVLESQQANVINVEDVYSVDTYDFNYTQTQYEILRSRNLAERVVRKGQLHKRPAFVGKPPDRPWYRVDLKQLLPASEKEPPPQVSAAELEERAIQNAAGMIAAGLQVRPVEYSYMMYLSYESSDPRLAAEVVNLVAAEFITSNLEHRLSGTLQATEWLGERLEDLKRNLRESEQALQDFRDREGLVDIEGVTGLGDNELRSLSQRLQEATRARIEAENIRQEVHGMADASAEQLMTVPAVLRHELVRDLKRDLSVAERRVAELAKRYGVRHPKMISAQSELAAAREDLETEVRKVVSGIDREYAVALRNEQQLQAGWEERKSDIQEFNRVEFRLQELQREVETNRQLYDVFFTRIKSVSETGGFEKPHARIVDRAMIPDSPVKPNGRLILVSVFCLALLFGCAVAVVLDRMDDTIKSPDDVLKRLHVPLLGALPLQPETGAGDIEHYWHNSRSGFAEAIRTVRTSLVLSGLDDPARVIVVTSTQPDEGKSTVALNLGAALGQMEKTLVIGADLRRPSLAQKCGLAVNHKGLGHFVAGSAELPQCIKYLEDLGIHVMPAGVIPPNPLEMISSRRFVEALEALGQQFDRIVLDSAPVQAVSDALVLSSYADSVVYVVKADATPTAQVQRGIARIVGSNEPFTGVVLNQFVPGRSKRYGGEEFYRYYGYSQDDTAAGA